MNENRLQYSAIFPACLYLGGRGGGGGNGNCIFHEGGRGGAGNPMTTTGGLGAAGLMKTVLVLRLS